jgi:hypothetical protein
MAKERRARRRLDSRPIVCVTVVGGHERLPAQTDLAPLKAEVVSVFEETKRAYKL